MDAARESGRRPRALSARQRLFVERFLQNGDAPAAALAAGYCPSRTASEGSRLQRLPQVRQAIEEGRRVQARQDRIHAAQIREELARIAFADISDFLRWDEAGVTLRPMDELSREQTACVAEIVESAGKTGKTLRVKLHGKLAALAALSRLLSGETRAADGEPRPVVVVTSVPEPAPLPDPAHPETAAWPPPRESGPDTPG